MGHDEKLSDIIRVCRENGVAEMTWGNITLRFMVDQNTQGRVISTDNQLQRTGAEGPPRPVMTPEQRQLISDYQQAQLMIDDPEAFEQSMIDSQLRGVL